MSSIVYDISELPKLSEFAYDIKILYQLKGYKVRSLNELCWCFLDQNDTTEWSRCCQRLKAHLRSYQECGIRVQDYPWGQLIPPSFHDTFIFEKERVVAKLFQRFSDEHVFSFYERFFPKVACLHNVAQNMGLKFNFVGSKTGRLSFKHNTFNPYVLPKEKRHCVAARPGFKIYQYDLKSSQPRIAIFSTCDNRFKQRFQDTEDIYSAFPGDREANKIGFLKWMFSSHYAADEKFAELAKPIKELRSDVFSDAVRDHVVYNRFGRPLFFENTELEPHRVFQNFISSTEADALYEILCKMQQVLEGKRSRILFPFYDAVICEIADEEEDVAQQLKSTIENNYIDHIFYCRLPVEMKCGADFGHLH